MTEPSTDALRVALRLTCDPATAFAHFTGQFGRWWPLDSHSVGQKAATSCGMELYPGGRIWELTSAGARHLWGRVLDCEEPTSLSFTWHPGRALDTAQNIDVCFRPALDAADGEATEVVLEQRDWHVFGPAAEHAREQYNEGWKVVLERFRRSVEESSSARSNPRPA